MELEQRFITLSEKGQCLAAEPAIDHVVETIFNSEFYSLISPEKHSYSMEELNYTIIQLRDSDFINSLTLAEKEQVIAIINNHNTEWSMPTIEDPIATIPRITRDILLLGGVTGLDLTHYGSVEILDRYQEFGFKDRLNFANFIGAIVMQKDTPDQAQNGIVADVHANGFSRIAIGGHPHGDFMIRQSTIYTTGSVDPVGNTQHFSPRPETQTFIDYHSVESEFLVSILKHMAATHSTEQQNCIIKALIEHHTERSAADTEPVAALYADYGTRDAELEINDMNTYFRTKQPHTSLLVKRAIATMRNCGTKIESRDDALVFSNFFIKNDETYTEIRLRNDYIASFIDHLLIQSRSGNGRSSDSTLMDVLAARYNMLEH